MYHIAGITPEAPDLETAVGGRKIRERITLTQKDLDETRERLCRKPGKIDFAMFGCPHLTIRQVAAIASLVDGRRLAGGTWILTRSLARELADRLGYLSVIRRTPCASTPSSPRRAGSSRATTTCRAK
jgi:predicted aconitase